jgi:general secretion pathway protein G
MIATRARGFTIIELMAVMAIIAVLLTLAAPQYFGHVQKAKEAVLRENLHAMRDAIDKYYGDNGHYPSALDDLVSKKYLRKIPADPFNDATIPWTVVAPEDPQKGAVFDVHSSATGKAHDGSSYAEW